MEKKFMFIRGKEENVDDRREIDRQCFKFDL